MMLGYHLKAMSNLIIFNMVRYSEHEKVNGKDNVIRPEILTMFPSLNTVTIRTFRGDHKFRLEALLETLRKITSPLTVNVHDDGRWAQKALSDHIAGEYKEAGWNIQYEAGSGGYYGDGGKLVIKSTGN